MDTFKRAIVVQCEQRNHDRTDGMVGYDADRPAMPNRSCTDIQPLPAGEQTVGRAEDSGNGAM